MEVTCIANDEENKEDCELEWEAFVTDDSKEIGIQLNFKSPPKVSQGEAPDLALI